MPPHLLFVRAPPNLPRMTVSVTGWPNFGTSCIPSDVGDCMRLVIAVCPAYGAKLGLIALLCQASHFPVFDWLLTSLKYLSQSANILSVATQVNLSFQCGAAAYFSLPRSIARALGLLALDGNGCGQPLYVLIGPSRECAVGSCEHRDLIKQNNTHCSRRTHAPSRPISPRPFASR